MTDDEARVIIRTIRLSPRADRAAKTAVGILAVAREADLSTVTLYRIAAGKRVGWRTMAACKRGIENIARIMGDQAPLFLRLELKAKPPASAPRRQNLTLQGLPTR